MNAWTEAIGWRVTAVAVAGVVLNNRRHRGCFALWLVSNAATLALHARAGMWALACRDAVFFALAIHGLVAWSRAAQGEAGRPT